MSMTPAHLREAVANMEDADLEQVIAALGRSRTTAMEQTVRARIPECANFGAVAQDLDYALSTIEDALPKTGGCPSRSELLKNIAQERGLKVVDIRLAACDARDITGIPVMAGKGN